MSYERFTYPFRYVPSPEITEAAKKLSERIDADPELEPLLREGKMLGVMVCIAPDGSRIVLEAFSGLVKGRSTLPGFVPPIFDTAEIPELRLPQKDAESSARLQDWLFRQYIVRNADGEELSIKDIFALRGIVPPGGTGECAGPKLLNYAYLHGLRPLSMGEFWYGESPRSGEVRQHGRFYPSCIGKCGPLMSWMMRGLDVEPNPLQRKTSNQSLRVIFADDSILVVDKPSGMLCVPGLTGTDSLQEILEKEYGKLFSCHRLDMDTSGVMVFARDPESQACIQQQFEKRETRKTYLAHLCAGTRPWKGRMTGTIALPLSTDYYDRPRQIVDKENGKPAITGFEILQIFPDGEMDVRFTPRTGRTHQLRVHAASPMGLGRPIKGDALYGSPSEGRLELYAESLEFRHPKTGEKLRFTV